MPQLHFTSSRVTSVTSPILAAASATSFPPKPATGKPDVMPEFPKENSDMEATRLTPKSRKILAAEIVENLEEALEEFRTVEEELKN